jgi:hypothetical protein
MSLLEWSGDRPDWQRDALRRIAQTGELSDADREAVRLRVRHAHGIQVDGDVTCTPLGAEHLPPGDAAVEPTILCGIGPLRNVDRLAPDQQLRFGMNGVTLIYGDNGTGKSGYARVAKKMCRARVIDKLYGNVFGPQVAPPAGAQFCFHLPGDDDPQDSDWQDGDPPPESLAQIMVLDEASARIYVDRQNEIAYLPREIEVTAHLGQCCASLGSEFERDAEEIARRYRAPFSAAYRNDTSAGRLVALLTLDSPLANLPEETALVEAGNWGDEKEAELVVVTAAIANDPSAQARDRRRIAEALASLAAEVETVACVLSDAALTTVREAIAETVTADQTALQAAEVTFAAEPLRSTGQDTWARMYGLARQFAAEAGERRNDESFAAGDPCPLCQRDLTEVEVERLARFDAFVRGAAAEAAGAARATLDRLATGIREVNLTLPDARRRALAEFEAFGDGQAVIAGLVTRYLDAALARRDTVLAGIEAGQLGEVAALPALPVESVLRQITLLQEEAVALEALPSDDQALAARGAELTDAKRLSESLDLARQRCTDLKMRRRLLECQTAVDTRLISNFATRRRRELVTPDLREKIISEIAKLDLSHIPLRFEEETDRGRNLFDVVLDTPQRAAKSRILSEGEKRALGIACFFAEVSRVPGRHGIIVDDPVSSLDHQRLQKVARRLVEEAAGGRQVIVFTHHLVFYQEILSAAAAADRPVPVIVNLIARNGDRFGVISEDDEPWIAKKVIKRVELLRQRLGEIRVNMIEAARNIADAQRTSTQTCESLGNVWLKKCCLRAS